MHRTGLILGTAVFFGGVVEWILRLTHYAELIERILPWTEHLISPTGIWVTMVVGILLFIAAWTERKKEKDEKKKSRGQHTEPVFAAPNQKLVQTANPVTTVDASQKVEIHNHPAPPPLPQSHHRITTEEPRHNVSFVRIEEYRTDQVMAGCIAEFPSGALRGIKVGFVNQAVPNRRVSSFRYVKARVSFRDETGQIVLDAYPCLWMDRPLSEHYIDLAVGHIEWVSLAAYCPNNQWSIFHWVRRATGYWEGNEAYEIDIKSLPAVPITAEVTLIGENGESIPPITVGFTLFDDGRCALN